MRLVGVIGEEEREADFDNEAWGEVGVEKRPFCRSNKGNSSIRSM